jgi:hypothetical protein
MLLNRVDFSFLFSTLIPGNGRNRIEKINSTVAKRRRLTKAVLHSARIIANRAASAAATRVTMLVVGQTTQRFQQNGLERQ